MQAAYSNGSIDLSLRNPNTLSSGAISHKQLRRWEYVVVVFYGNYAVRRSERLLPSAHRRVEGTAEGETDHAAACN